MIQRRIAVLLLTFLLAIPAVAAAQTPVGDASPEPKDLHPGMQAGVMRTYAHPDASTGRAVTVEEMATLTARTIDVYVTSFDTPENAGAYFDVTIGTPFQLQPASGQEVIVDDASSIEGIGSKAYLRQQMVHGDEGTMAWQQLFFQRDTYVVWVMISWDASYRDGMEAPAEITIPEAIVPLATQIAVDGQPSPDPVEFAEDGTSTGGLWEFMPVTGDPLLLGLEPWVDVTTYPPPAMATPT